MHSLPIFLCLQDKPVILIGSGNTADAKRRLLERAGADVVGEDAQAQLAIVVDDDAAVARLKARGVLVNAVDRPDLCDFTLPAIVDRDPVIVAIGTGGASAGLAAALRQRLEALLPTHLGDLAAELYERRDQIRAQWPDAEARRRALAAALQQGGELDPLGADPDVFMWIDEPGMTAVCDRVIVAVRSADPDELTVREARLLGQADRVYHAPAIAPAILARVRADAPRILGAAPDEPQPGLTLILEHANG